MNFKGFFAITLLITESIAKIEPEFFYPCFQLLNATGHVLKKLALNSALEEPCNVLLLCRLNPVLFQHFR